MTEKDSLLNKIAALVRRVAPELPFVGTFTYTVSRDNGDGSIDVTPAASVQHPPHLRVEQRAAPGIEAGLSVGDEVLITFRQPGNRPAIIGHAPLNRSTPDALKIDCASTLRIGESASLVHLGSGTSPLAIGAEITGRRVVCYGDNVTIPVAGAAAVGAIVQNPATAPNAISKVRV